MAGATDQALAMQPTKAQSVSAPSVSPHATAAPSLTELPYPDALKSDIDFWRQIYGRVDSRGGLLHDDRHLNVVYLQVSFTSSDHNERVAQVERERQKIQADLRDLALHPSEPANFDQRRLLDLWGGHLSAAECLAAAEQVRFQLGQADRTRAGLARALLWQPYLEQALAAQGVPKALWVLPLVESSFAATAVSKAGAAGVWQLMPAVALRQLRMDRLVDERFDPIQSANVAAKILANNHRVLGSWPLAITAYNHGLSGTLRGTQTLNTSDIVSLVREYRGNGFGLASRNFYVAYCAVLDIATHADAYFGHMEAADKPTLTSVRLARALTMAEVVTILQRDAAELKAWNPALKAPLWGNAVPIPAGVTLWVPGALSSEIRERLAAPVRPQ